MPLNICYQSHSFSCSRDSDTANVVNEINRENNANRVSKALIRVRWWFRAGCAQKAVLSGCGLAIVGQAWNPTTKDVFSVMGVLQRFSSPSSSSTRFCPFPLPPAPARNTRSAAVFYSSCCVFIVRYPCRVSLCEAKWWLMGHEIKVARVHLVFCCQSVKEEI